MILLNIIWAVLVFFILLIFSLGSYCVLSRSSATQQSRNGKSSAVLSLCNCFACGVFLSTCFIGLIPHIREHEVKLRTLWASERKVATTTETSNILIKTELIVLGGFLFILLVEQVFHTCGHCSPYGHTHRNCASGNGSSAAGSKGGGEAVGTTTATALLSIGGDEEPLVLNRLDSEDSEEDGVESTPKIEFRRIDDASDQHRGSSGHGGHSHLNMLSGSGKRLTLSSCFLLLGLSTHSLFEGVALGVQTDESEFYELLLAIMLHEVLCSFAFGVNLAQQRIPIGVAFFAASLLASCIPFGMCTSILVNSLDSTASLLVRFFLEGLAAGTFIYVACVEMLSAELHVSSTDHAARSGLYKAVAVIAGVVIFFGITVLFGRHRLASSPITAPTLPSHIRAIHY
ncbi:Zinc transporter ZIP3 [Toxocara canis]|uniref:Zinc transporter ZIP3 n=1 Tax=Toxocara canis TaxID=6265 RepID=A0A0B2VIN9_TOXCA|nr:Zinc transporter ZIP3 [Toxocara canis]